MAPPHAAMPASLLSSKPNTPRRDRRDVSPANSGYFGLAMDGSNGLGSSGARMVKGGSGISIRSAAASPPHTLPFHSNQDFDAFRQAAAAESGKFDLNPTSMPKITTPTGHIKPPSLDRRHSKQTPSTPKLKSSRPSSQSFDHSAVPDSSPVSRSPNKRLLSIDSTDVWERPRRESPASFTDEDDARASGSPPSKHDEKFPRLVSDSDRSRVIPSGLAFHKSETLPEKFETEEEPSMITPQYIVNILDSQSEDALILDLRVSTQYARSRISGALNLCIPTTLLKRSTYNVSRLRDTFRDDEQRAKFENWKDCKCIIVYDTSSSHMKEAANCINILKKFISEGWEGRSYIARGGFSEFSRKFPKYLDHGDPTHTSSSAPDLSIKTDEGTIAPVIGGCPMPASATKNAVNPFFGNIRQNTDLIGGVGQMQIKMPSTSRQQRSNLPLWLRNATDENDKGKSVSDKFYYVEKREQKRMQEALSGNVIYNSTGSGESKDSEPKKSIQIAGIEKGAKNRYNNIWPFEHTRVKLEGVSSHGCDYVNANYVQSSLSNKKFIATQGPIPETFTDFWKMVWQRDVRVIVMLTAETEGGQVKAHNYWNNKSYGPFKVHYLSEQRASLEISKIRSHRERPSLGKHRSSVGSSSSASNSTPGSASTPRPSPSSSTDKPFVYVRKFTLYNEAEPFERMREITHLQYSSWPDFGAPAHPAHLLGLVEQCDSVVRADTTSSSKMEAAPSNQRPVLVHCSAGCGRTGTFCTVDSVIDILKKQKNFERNRQRAKSLQQHVKTSDVVRQSSSMDIDQTSPGASSKDAGAQELALDVSWLGRDDLDFVEKTVEEFRLQRLSMVQSLRQFVLCYETVLEWLLAQHEEES